MQACLITRTEVAEWIQGMVYEMGLDVACTDMRWVVLQHWGRQIGHVTMNAWQTKVLVLRTDAHAFQCNLQRSALDASLQAGKQYIAGVGSLPKQNELFPRHPQKLG